MSLLFDFRPLVINPLLAERIGLNEAIVLQQLKYWLSETDSGVEHDGRRWIYNTLEQWQKQFPFWSAETVKRTLSSLQKQGLVLVEKLAKARHDHTNYYAINYESDDLFDQVNLTRSDEVNLNSSAGSDCPVLHTEITTKSTTENSVAAQLAPAKPKRPAKPKDDVEQARQEACREIWSTYSTAYEQRHAVAPVRNAKVNKQVVELWKRLGQEAASVAAYFVGINDGYLIRNCHDFGSLLAKAEVYRTQWATNLQMNATTAQQIERKQANLSAGQEAASRILSREGGAANEFL